VFEHHGDLRAACDNRRVNPVAEAFTPVIGLPAWNAVVGDLWHVSIEFGEPALTVLDVRDAPLHVPGAPPTHVRRPIFVHGQWSLYIASDDFSLMLDGELIAASTSDSNHLEASLFRVLNGQILQGVEIDQLSGATDFTFDLGATLRTSIPVTPESEPREQWLLSEPDGNWFVVNDKSQYSRHSGRTPPDQIQWATLHT